MEVQRKALEDLLQNTLPLPCQCCKGRQLYLVPPNSVPSSSAWVPVAGVYVDVHQDLLHQKLPGLPRKLRVAKLRVHIIPYHTLKKVGIGCSSGVWFAFCPTTAITNLDLSSFGGVLVRGIPGFLGSWDTVGLILFPDNVTTRN